MTPIFYCQGHAEYTTPHLDTLAREGVMLNDYYVNQLCSPTRTSLISSRYAYNLGLAGGVITNGVSSAKMALTLPFLCCFCTFEALFRCGNIRFERVRDSRFGTTRLLSAEFSSSDAGSDACGLMLTLLLMAGAG